MHHFADITVRIGGVQRHRCPENAPAGNAEHHRNALRSDRGRHDGSSRKDDKVHRGSGVRYTSGNTSGDLTRQSV